MNKTTKPNILAVIPARGGSKGLPGKNIKLIGGKPLLWFPINYSLASKMVTHTIVSTDSKEIAEWAIKCGASVPFLRPSELANDETKTELVLYHALLEMERIHKISYDYCIFLTATSIFRGDNLIEKGVNIMLNNEEIESCFVGYKTTKNYWEMSESGNWTRILPWMKEYGSRQTRKYIIREDTGIFSISVASIWRDKRRIGDKVEILISDDEFSNIDIHTLEDFSLASCAVKLRGINSFG